jgi:hypothetical protein
MGSFKIRLAEVFSLSPLIVACVVGILLWVVEFGLFMELPLVLLVLIYIFWITPNYFFEIIEFKALGNEGWPVFSLETLVAGRSQVGVVFSVLVLAVAGGCVALHYFELDTPAQILLGAGLILLPGSVALLAVTREFLVALNPLRVLAAAVGMGHAYLYCLFGTAAILVLLELAQTRGGLLLYVPLVYALFLQAYLIGSIVYARRAVLGVNARRSPEAWAERARAETVATRKGVLSHAYGFAAHGNVTGALDHIERYIAVEEDTLEARLWMFYEIARWEDRETALEIGRRVIDYCERHAFTDEAARVRSMCDHLNASQSQGAAR